jgi:hypothetical protein
MQSGVSSYLSNVKKNNIAGSSLNKVSCKNFKKFDESHREDAHHSEGLEVVLPSKHFSSVLQDQRLRLKAISTSEATATSQNDLEKDPRYRKLLKYLAKPLPEKYEKRCSDLKELRECFGPLLSSCELYPLEGYSAVLKAQVLMQWLTLKFRALKVESGPIVSTNAAKNKAEQALENLNTLYLPLEPLLPLMSSDQSLQEGQERVLSPKRVTFNDALTKVYNIRELGFAGVDQLNDKEVSEGNLRPIEPAQPETTIIVPSDSVPAGCQPYIRGAPGSGPDVTWDRGALLNKNEGGTYSFSFKGTLKERWKFKILLSDGENIQWEEGADHEISMGETQQVIPKMKLCFASIVAHVPNASSGETVTIAGDGPGMDHWGKHIEMLSSGSGNYSYKVAALAARALKKPTFEFKLHKNGCWAKENNQTATFGETKEIMAWF